MRERRHSLPVRHRCRLRTRTWSGVPVTMPSSLKRNILSRCRTCTWTGSWSASRCGWTGPSATKGSLSCSEAKNPSGYACIGANSECVDESVKGTGYFCKCKKGFEGNPYDEAKNGCTSNYTTLFFQVQLLPILFLDSRPNATIFGSRRLGKAH